MKTTVEIPDSLFRQVKAIAAKRISMKEFFTAAVSEQLRQESAELLGDRPWMKAFGGLRELRRENRHMDRIIVDEFERIDPEEWH